MNVDLTQAMQSLTTKRTSWLCTECSLVHAPWVESCRCIQNKQARAKVGFEAEIARVQAGLGEP
jgi:hypothetical protein